MKLAIIDSNNADATLIKDLIVKYFDTYTDALSIYSYPCADSFFQDFSENLFTFVFLDMDTPNTPTLAAAEYIRKIDKNINLILMSRGMDYAIQGYTVQASYYLLKPFTYSNIETALNLCPILTTTLKPFVEVIVNRIPQLIFLDDILYIDTIHNGIQIHTELNTFKTYMSFKNFLQFIKNEDRFLQCYRGIVVNMDYISTLQNDSFLLFNGETIPIRIPDRYTLRDTYNAYTLKKSQKVLEGTITF